MLDMRVANISQDVLKMLFMSCYARNPQTEARMREVILEEEL